MAKIYHPDGTVTGVQPKNGSHFKLKELQDIVGGLIDIATTRDGREAIVFNDEGKILGLDYNKAATEIYQSRVYEYDFLVGNVLVCNNEEIK